MFCIRKPPDFLNEGAKRLPIDPTTLQEFKTFFKYLAFVASAAKAPVRQQMLHETLARIAKAGVAENIERWCWWTPTQLSLLDQADRLTRVIIIGGNGTGKTIMLDAFAAKTAKEHPDQNVIFAIHQRKTSSVRPARPLLQLDLEVKYEKAKMKNVTVKTFRSLSELSVANLTNFTVCVDEVDMEDVKPEELQTIQAKAVWIVIRKTRQQRNHEVYLREKFPEPWVIVNLSYPLRTSKNLSDKVKSGKIAHALHNNNFNSTLQVVPNMPLGPEPLTLPLTEGSYQARLQLVFSGVGIDKLALIILGYSVMKPTFEEIQEANVTTIHQQLAEKTDEYSQNILVAIEAVKACQRPHGLPLLWFESEYAFVSHDKASIKEWMAGRNKNICGKDLITDVACVPGYEADFVIYLGANDLDVPAYMSRCRGQFVHIE